MEVIVDTITAPAGKLQAFSTSTEGIICHERFNPSEVFFVIPWSALWGTQIEGSVSGRATITTLPPNVRLTKSMIGNTMSLNCRDAPDFWLQFTPAEHIVLSFL